MPDAPHEPLSLYTLVLVLIPILIAAIVVSVAKQLDSSTRRDFRNDGIRSLEAGLRVAKRETEKSRDELERLEKELKDLKMVLVRRDNVIAEQQSKIKKIQSDLRYSVIKTRELRAELVDRATEIVHAEARIREVETELLLSRTTTDLMALNNKPMQRTEERDGLHRPKMPTPSAKMGRYRLPASQE